MNVPLSLSIALILFSCYGNVSSKDENETIRPSSSESTTPYYDYDYNATFEYYYGNVSSKDENETIRPSSSESTTPYYDYDYNATFEYYYVNNSFIDSNETVDVRQIINSSCRSITDRSLLISSLLLSLAALFH